MAPFSFVKNRSKFWRHLHTNSVLAPFERLHIWKKACWICRMDIYPYGFRIRKDHWIGCWPWNVLREDVESRSSEYRLKMMAGLYVRLDENWFQSHVALNLMRGAGHVTDRNS